jgi:hypothetical protein
MLEPIELEETGFEGVKKIPIEWFLQDIPD